jgi:hypothetical protein
MCGARDARRTLRVKARLLLSIAQYLSLAERPDDKISLSEIEKGASRWSSHNWPLSKSCYAKLSREFFIAQAAGWLRFLNRLQTVPKPVKVYDQMLAEFSSFMKEDRGLSRLRLNTAATLCGHSYIDCSMESGFLTRSPSLMSIRSWRSK